MRTVQRRFDQGKLPSWSDLAAGVGHLTTKPLKEAGADWLDAWAAHLRHPRFQSELASIIEGLLGMAASAGQAFTQAKQAERLLEFDDMLAQAAALLNLPAAQDKLAGRIEGAPAGRAAAEWALLNKVLAPVSFPTKMWIAHKIVQRRAAVADTMPQQLPAPVHSPSKSS